MISKAFSAPKNDLLHKVCKDIADNSLKAYYPKGADLKTSKLCAIVNSATYSFDEKYKKDDKMIYFEYKLDSS